MAVGAVVAAYAVIEEMRYRERLEAYWRYRALRFLFLDEHSVPVKDGSWIEIWDENRTFLEEVTGHNEEGEIRTALGFWPQENVTINLRKDNESHWITFTVSEVGPRPSEIADVVLYHDPLYHTVVVRVSKEGS